MRLSRMAPSLSYVGEKTPKRSHCAHSCAFQVYDVLCNGVFHGAIRYSTFFQLWEAVRFRSVTFFSRSLPSKGIQYAPVALQPSPKQHLSDCECCLQRHALRVVFCYHPTRLRNTLLCFSIVCTRHTTCSRVQR